MSEYNPFWKAIGSWTLYTLIAFGLLTLGIFAYAKMWYWFVAIGVCFGGVIGAEIVSFIVLKKSISQQYGLWIKKGGKSAVMAYLGLICFSLAMCSLVLHLVAYGLR
jgi:hypothetical membrane protein